MPYVGLKNEPSDMINCDSLSLDEGVSSQCELCGKNCTVSWKNEDSFHGHDNRAISTSPDVESDCTLAVMCINCRSKLGDMKDVLKKFEKLENKVESLNRRIYFLTFHNSNLSHSSNYNSGFYYQNSNCNSFSPCETRRKFVKSFNKIFSYGNNNKCDGYKKDYQQTSSRSRSLGSELKTPLTYCNDNNNESLSPNTDNKQLLITKPRSTSNIQNNSFNEMLREFCENTSFHGFPEWYRAQNVYMKTLWILIISFGLIGTGYEVYNVVNDYRTAPTSTVYEFETPDDGMIFPQILLCNTNFLNGSRARMKNYSNAVVNAAKFLILNPVEDVIGSVFDPYYAYLSKNLADSDAAASRTFMPDVLEDLQYDQKEFIKACFFDQQPCEVFNISINEAPDAEYGVCFLVSVNSLQTKSGEGLQLVLDTHSDLWWAEQPTFGHGVVVRIEKTYNPGVLRSYFVLPNHITKISLSAVHYKMLDTSKCRDDMVRKIFNSNVTYSEDICRMECFFRVALKNCGCIRSMPPEYLYEANLPQCFNSTQQSCLKQASIIEKHDLDAQHCKRQCLPPCDSWDYRASISMLKFPADPVVSVMEEMYNKSAEESRFGDFVILDIAFDQLRVTNIKQQVSITPDGFLSQIGGHLGLFLGASLMSVVHMIVVCFQWVVRYFTQKVTRNCRYSEQNGTV